MKFASILILGFGVVMSGACVLLLNEQTGKFVLLLTVVTATTTYYYQRKQSQPRVDEKDVHRELRR